MSHVSFDDLDDMFDADPGMAEMIKSHTDYQRSKNMGHYDDQIYAHDEAIERRKRKRILAYTSVTKEKWDLRFIELAWRVASWSKDPSTKVGSVIVAPNRTVLGLGYNGFPRGVGDYANRYDDRPQKYKFVVHAEPNAILTAGQIPPGSTLYCTLFPCNECAKLIIQAGITRVVAPIPPESNWTEAFEISKEMFYEAGISWYFTED